MKTVFKMLAKLEGVTRADGAPWPDDDRRCGVVGRSGLVSIRESERLYPGMRIAEFTFLAWKEDGRWRACAPEAYWRTSYGFFEVTRPGLAMKTTNSLYDFAMLRGREVDDGSLELRVGRVRTQVAGYGRGRCERMKVHPRRA